MSPIVVGVSGSTSGGCWAGSVLVGLFKKAILKCVAKPYDQPLNWVRFVKRPELSN
jgi:hypothetical protein